MFRLLVLGLLASASCLQVPKTGTHRRVPKRQLDAAFSAWREKQLKQTAFVNQVNRLASPDVSCHITFEGLTHKANLPGGATTDTLHKEAARLHNLDPDQQLKFFYDGGLLAPGVPISETHLANTRNAVVLVMAAQWPIRRVKSNEWWSGSSASA